MIFGAIIALFTSPITPSENESQYKNDPKEWSTRALRIWLTMRKIYFAENEDRHMLLTKVYNEQIRRAKAALQNC